MRFRNTLILGVLFVALAGYVYFVEFRRAEEANKKETLFHFAEDDARAVTLKYPDREIALEKIDGHWKLTQPVQAPADDSATKNLIKAIADCEIKKRLGETPADLKPFGLDNPDVVIRVKLADRELPEIKVGKTTPVGYSTYIQRADDPQVMLTTAAFHSGMQKQVRDLRDKQILSFEDADVKRISISGPDRDLLLTRSDGGWKIERPRDLPADDSVVRSYLSSLRTMRATDFPEENPSSLAPYGLENPRLKITVFVGKDEDRKEFLVGNEAENNKVYVKSNSRPTIYEVNEWVQRELDKGVNEFRDKTVLTFDKDAVTAVTVAHANGETFTLVRKDGRWQVEGAEEEVVDAIKADQLLSDLHSLRAYQIVADTPESLEPFGLASPLLSITLRKGEDVLGTIKIGTYSKGEEKAYAAVHDGSSTVFGLQDYQVSRIDKRRASFLTPHPTPTTQAQAS